MYHEQRQRIEVHMAGSPSSRMRSSAAGELWKCDQRGQDPDGSQRHGQPKRSQEEAHGMDRSQNGENPKRRQPKRRQNQNGENPKRRQAKTATRQNADTFWRVAILVLSPFWVQPKRRQPKRRHIQNGDGIPAVLDVSPFWRVGFLDVSPFWMCRRFGVSPFWICRRFG